MTAPSLVALLLILFQIPAGTQTPKGSIEGVVLRAGSGEPLSGAEVRLNRVRSEEEMRAFYAEGNYDPDGGIPPVLTESDGKFIFQDVDPAQYRLTAMRNGYPRQSYGQKVSLGPATVVSVRPGQPVKDIQFRLIQGGVVTGRVRDAAGEPLAGLTVYLMRSSYDSSGKKTFNQFEAKVTDDRGEYRFYWVDAGRYYVMANGSIVDRPMPRVFYPGVVDSEGASAIDVQAGLELSAVDIVIPNVTGYRITGRLVEASTGKPPKSASVQITPKKQTAVVVYQPEPSSDVQYNSSTGVFQIRNVLPGSYWLTASSQNDSDEVLPADRLAEVRNREDLFRVAYSSRLGAQTPIEVSGADLNDVVLTLKKGISIPVRVSVEGQDLAATKGSDSIRLNLQSDAGAGRWMESSRLSAEGVGRVDDVRPSEYQVHVDLGTTKDLYVKELVYGREDALHDPIRISDQAPSTIGVVLSTKGGQVEGLLTDALSQPVAGAEVLLIPDNRDHMRLFDSATTDPDGRFVLRNVPPGGYKVFSWEALEPGAHFDSEVLSRYETQGRPVRIQESSKETVNLRIIPAAKP